MSALGTPTSPIGPQEGALAGKPSGPRASRRFALRRWIESRTVAPVGSSMLVARRYHFGAGGVAYAVTTLVLIIGAVNGQNNLLFLIFGAAVAGLLVSGVVSGWSMLGLRLTRRPPGVMRVGEIATLRYDVSNTSRLLPACGLLIEELPRAVSAVGVSFEATSQRGLGAVCCAVVRVPARGRVLGEASVLPRRRGSWTLTPMRVGSKFPFGLTRKSVTFVQQDRVLVWPASVRVPLPASIASALGDQRGAGAPMRAGAEFFALREYQQGDSLRAISWRASARADAPIVRTYTNPPGARAWIVLDLAGTSDDLEREQLIALASGTHEQLIEAGREVGMQTAGGTVLVAPSRGMASREAALDALALLDAQREAQVTSVGGPALRGNVVWVCAGGASVPTPEGAALLDVRSEEALEALSRTPVLLASEAGEGSITGQGWLDALLREWMAWGQATWKRLWPAGRRA